MEEGEPGALTMLTIAFVLGGVLLGFALLLGGLYELGKYCNRKPRTKPGSVLSEPLLCDVDDGIAADALAAAADPMPSNAWSEKSRIVIPFPKERLAQLQIERLVNDAGVLNGPAQLPPLLRSVGEAGTPSDFRNEGIGWLSMPVSHRAELWVALLSRYGPLGSAASVTSGASSVCSDGKDGEHNDKSVVNPLLASPSASAYGIHVQHQDDADLISFDARRCKFSKYRVEPYAGRLEWLIRKWVRENPSCQYYQVGVHTIIAVLRVSVRLSLAFLANSGESWLGPARHDVRERIRPQEGFLLEV